MAALGDHELPRALSFRMSLWTLCRGQLPAVADLGLSPRRSLAASRASAARARLPGPSALARTTVAHRQGFISGYLIFGCRQNETARTGRLACVAHKSENRADLSARAAARSAGRGASCGSLSHGRAKGCWKNPV